MDILIARLREHHSLDPSECNRAVAHLLDSNVADERKIEFLRLLTAKGETSDEIAAFARALLTYAVDPQLDAASLPGPLIDVCGTGGDRRSYFNVSTTVMFVASAAGACIAKHGNRSITSRTGAADVLEALGVPIDPGPTRTRENLERHGLAFFFAPAWHPAFRAIIPARKALAAEGVATIFNLLGPLLNPARPQRQLVGVYSPALLPKYAAALAALGREAAWAVHGDGTDEIALTGTTTIHTVQGGASSHILTLDPTILGLQRCSPADLLGGDRDENARILRAILDGTDRGPRRDMVLLNTAAALHIAGIESDLHTAIDRARAAIDSGAALGKLTALATW